MSLFRIRELWNYSSPGFNDHQSEFSIVIVGNLIGDTSKDYQIISAHQSGQVAIFRPKNSSSDTLSIVSDSCVDYRTEQPIVSMCTGTVNPEDTSRSCICFLHPSKLSVCNLSNPSLRQSGSSDPANVSDIWTVDIAYEISLRKQPFNMCLGKQFAQCDHKSICIQSIDCEFLVYSGKSLLFSTATQYSLVPGPTFFLNCTTSFVTVSTSRELIMRKYDTPPQCPSCTADSDKNNKAPDVSEIGVQPNQITNVVVGEPLFQLSVVEHDETDSAPIPQAYMIGLGRHSVSMFSETCQSIGTYGLEMVPRVLCVYGRHKFLAPSNGVSWQPKFCVATEEMHLLVFRGLQIVWSALLPACPISLAMQSLDSTGKNDDGTLPSIGQNNPPGLITILYPNGKLSLCYLGTQLSSAVCPDQTFPSSAGDAMISPHALEKSELKLETLDEEINKLTTESPSETALLDKLNHNVPNNGTQVVRLSATPQSSVAYSTTVNTDEAPELRVAVSLTLPFTTIPSSVFLNARTCPPFLIIPNRCQMTIVTPPQGQTYTCTLSVQFDSEHALFKYPPMDLTVHVIAQYIDPTASAQAPCVKFTQTQLRIPLNWICHATEFESAEVRNIFKLTFDLAPTAARIPLKHLLPKLWPINYTGSNLHIQLKYPGHPDQSDCEKSSHDVYVLHNIDTHQLTFQGSSPAMAWLVLQELYTELIHFVCSSGSPLPTIQPLLMLASMNSENSTLEAEPTEMPSKDPLNPVIISFLNQFTIGLENHLDTRLALATRSAACAVQARHLRIVQQNVCTRLRDNVPKPLNGFDALLEASLHALMQHCQLALQYTDQHWQNGCQVLSIVALITFICANCYRRENQKKPTRLIYPFQPSRLLALLETSDHLDPERGISTVPEFDRSSTNPEASTEPIPTGQQIALEECLELTILDLLHRINSDSKTPPIPNHVSTSSIPHVGRITQHLHKLCSCLSQAKNSVEHLIGLESTDFLGGENYKKKQNHSPRKTPARWNREVFEPASTLSN